MSGDVVQYQVEVFHGRSGLRNYQDVGSVKCEPTNLLPMTIALCALIGSIVAKVEHEDATQFEDYEICLFVCKKGD